MLFRSEAVTVTDTTNTSVSTSITITVASTIAITGSATVTSTYGSSLTTTAYTWTGGTGSLTATLSPSITGISFDASTGIFTVANNISQGNYSETLTVTDSIGAKTNLLMTFTVNRASGPVVTANTWTIAQGATVTPTSSVSGLQLSDAATVSTATYTYTGKNSTVYASSTNAPTGADRKSTRLNSSHIPLSRMPSSA